MTDTTPFTSTYELGKEIGIKIGALQESQRVLDWIEERIKDTSVLNMRAPEILIEMIEALKHKDEE